MTDWTVRVEFVHNGAADEATVDNWMEQLAGLSPAIGCGAPTGDGRTPCSATVSLDAPSLRQAITTALRAVEDAVEARAIGVEILPTDEFDRRLDEPLIPELVGYAEIAEILGVSRQRAREIATTIKPFPAVAVHVASGPLYVRSSVEAWAKAWERKPGRPKSASGG